MASNPIAQVTGGNSAKTGALLVLLLVLFLVWLDNTGRLQNIINAIRQPASRDIVPGNVLGLPTNQLPSGSQVTPIAPNGGSVAPLPPMSIPPGSKIDENGVHLPPITGISPSGDPIFQAQ